MRRIDELKFALGQAILESEEYRSYKEALAEIRKRPDLMRELDEYRKKSFTIQNSSEVDNMFDATLNLNREYDTLVNTGEVSRFLMCELMLSMLIQDICKSILEPLDFDIDFLNS